MECSRRRNVGFGLSLMLVLAMIFTSFSPYVKAAEITDSSQIAESIYPASYISFGPGSDETAYNFSWYVPRTTETAVIEFAKKPATGNGNFPSGAATSVTTKVADATNGYSSQKASIQGLLPETDYLYRLGDGNGKWTETYSFTTQKTDAFNFIFVGDPQIGSGNIANDAAGWTQTVNEAYAKFPNSSFLLTAGDQVNVSTSEEEYEGYFSPALLTQFPTATTVGNHDNSVLYPYHFNVPNESALGNTDAGGNYHFTNGDALFMVINTNSRNMEEHVRYLEETVRDNPKKWNFVMFHHSIYSAASHSLETGIIKLRNDLVPTFDKLNIDTVFMGHDHVYVRSHQMLADQPLLAQTTDELGRVINPKGTLYITGNSASGSKFYKLKPDPEPYAAVREQLRVPTFSNINLTDTTFELTTYRVDTMEEVDTYTIVKDDSIEMEEAKLAKVTLDTNETTLPLEETVFYENIQLEIAGENETGGLFDIPYADINYKTDNEQAIAISDRGKISLKEGATVGKANVWVEVQANGKTFISNKVTIDIIEHLERSLLELVACGVILITAPTKEQHGEQVILMIVTGRVAQDRLAIL